jgi:uncharacterized membrane protein YkvA (DUF1232 family)
MLEKLKHRARQLRRELQALYLACQDPRTPWYARVFTACVVAYALSPIDLIPDFIPVLGYLDDLLLVPAGIYLALRMIPAPVLEACRHRAALRPERPVSRAGAVAVVLLWLLVAAAAVYLFLC